jgi:hypothetical protein
MNFHSKIFKIAVFAFIFLAVNHLINVFIKIDSSSSTTRHLVFVFINLFFSYLFWKKSKWLLLLYPILMVQQLMGHGKRLVTELAQNDFHFVDIIVVILLPVALYSIVTLFIFSKKSGQ